MSIRRRLTAVVVAVLAAATLLGVAPAPARAATAYGPNRSILFYQNGLLVTGELRDGTFSQGPSYNIDHITHAAVSRDTVLMYNRSTGWATVAYLVGGVYWPSTARSVYLGTGWTHVLASCDTYLLYQAGSGRAQTGLLENGTLTVRANYGFSGIWQRIAASCNTVQFLYEDAYGDGWEARGYLSGGYFNQTGASQFGNMRQMTHLTATADSYNTYSRGDRWGNWGVQNNGTYYALGATDTFSAWDVVAGTSDSLLFYNRSSGVGASARLVGGEYTYRTSYGFSPGWQVIAGGK